MRYIPAAQLNASLRRHDHAAYHLGKLLLSVSGNSGYAQNLSRMDIKAYIIKANQLFIIRNGKIFDAQPHLFSPGILRTLLIRFLCRSIHHQL